MLSNTWIIKLFLLGLFLHLSNSLQCYECFGRDENCLTGLKVCPSEKIRCLVIFEFQLLDECIVGYYLFFRLEILIYRQLYFKNFYKLKQRPGHCFN